jgi:FkbM family methyltransferase
MSLFSLLKIILEHPLNKNQQVKALLRFIKWQVGSRLVPGEIIYHWVNDARFIVRPGETGLTQNIYCGLYDFSEMAYVLHVLNSEDLFIDIGANAGSYTILACAVKGAVGICFEPVPSTYRRLVNNLKLNDLLDHVKPYNIGLADTEGDLLFTSGLDTSNHMVGMSEARNDAIKVKVFPLDQVIAGASPTLIKMDVEGLETLVIKGMHRTLDNPSLHSVIMELNDSGLRYGFDDETIVKSMLGFGFRMYTYEPFSRELSPLLAKNNLSANTLFLRNIDLINQRLLSAPRFKVGSFEI